MLTLEEARSSSISRLLDANAPADEEWANARTRAQSLLSERNEQMLIGAFTALREEQLARYETSLAEDERLLREEEHSQNACRHKK